MNASVPFGADDRAVSPVIATLFMIAVTIIAVGTVGVLILDLGSGLKDAPPQAGFTFSYTQNETAGDELYITHVAGDDLPKESIKVRFEDVYVSYHDGGDTVYGPSKYPDESIDWADLELDDQSAGDTVSVSEIKQRYMQEKATGGDPEDVHLHLEKATIKIVYEGEEGSTIVDEWSGPDA